ncbi:MAG: hypothetical protein Q4G03_01125 [Planctomycetia bacterium]|nr:hypothetical protein [Planctomycetia bacterium]
MNNDKKGKRPGSKRRTAHEREILSDLQAFAEGRVSDVAEQTLLPEITVGMYDFDPNDLFVRTAPKLVAQKVKPRVKRLLFLFPCPYKWQNLPTWRAILMLLFRRENIATTVSILFHLLLAFVLASIILTTKVGIFGTIDGGFSDLPGDLDLVDELGDSIQEEYAYDPSEFEIDQDAFLTPLQTEDQTTSSLVNELTQDSGAPTLNVAESGQNTALTEGGGIALYHSGGTLKSRAERKRGNQGRQGDVTKASEDAVERGLQWIARHQYSDGGWAFDLTESDFNGRPSPCQGCSNSSATSGGTQYRTNLHPSRMAATAIALLPFLGSGYTHVEKNPYQETIERGLRFLTYNAKQNEYGIDFREDGTHEGASYIQALCVITLCEAYEMTKDESLRPYASEGMLFIENSQLNDGGWRYYSPGDLGFHKTSSGDTSVVGWQMMALKSGVSAGFDLPVAVTYRVNDFLDLVMEKNGRYYRYLPNRKDDDSQKWGVTAVGVLTREYLGWTPENPELENGAKQIAQWFDRLETIWQRVQKGAKGARSSASGVTYYREDRLIYNLYFAYYGALALHNYGGKYWSERFPKVRDFLVATQFHSSLLGRDACQNGSWLFYDQYMNDGGRLLNTALSILILETPYRYLPMYQ